MAAEALVLATDRTIHREVLDNGLTIMTEQMDHIRSVSMGVWLKAGSRNEEPRANGISHFVEHMVFKGTTRRSAEDIAREVDSIGGNMDAFTGKETVCFNMMVLDEHLPIAVDVLSDMVLHPVFDEAEIGRERGVIAGRDQDGRGQPRQPRARDLYPEFLQGPSAGKADPGDEGDGAKV